MKKAVKATLQRLMIATLILGILTSFILVIPGTSVKARDIVAVETEEEADSRSTIRTVVVDAALLFNSATAANSQAIGQIHRGAHVEVLSAAAGPINGRFQVRVLNSAEHNGWAGTVAWVNRSTIGM